MKNKVIQDLKQMFRLGVMLGSEIAEKRTKRNKLDKMELCDKLYKAKDQILKTYEII